MKKARVIVGVLLIVCAAAGLVFWEMKGREAVTTDQVLVAARTIEGGTKITQDMFLSAPVPEKLRIRGSLSATQFSKIQGLAAAQTIRENAQVSTADFQKDGFYLSGDQSIYVIPEEWIYMRSSALRRGDRIAVYGKAGGQELGSYQVAFVKDSAEREVLDVGESRKSRTLERTDSTSQISRVEIISDMAGYQKLKQAAEAGWMPGEETKPELLIVYQPEDRRMLSETEASE